MVLVRWYEGTMVMIHGIVCMRPRLETLHREIVKDYCMNKDMAVECSPSLRSECMVLPYHKSLILIK